MIRQEREAAIRQFGVLQATTSTAEEPVAKKAKTFTPGEALPAPVVKEPAAEPKKATGPTAEQLTAIKVFVERTRVAASRNDPSLLVTSPVLQLAYSDTRACTFIRRLLLTRPLWKRLRGWRRYVPIEVVELSTTFESDEAV